MSNTKKKHHYVPRFLLRQFSENKTHLWAYDKTTGKSHGSPIMDLGSENRFYSIPDKFLTKPGNNEFVEDIYEDIDTRSSKSLFEFLQNIKSAALLSPSGFPKYFIPDHLMHELGWLAVIQTVRTKEFREFSTQTKMLFQKAIFDWFLDSDQIKKISGKSKPELKITIEEGGEALEHSRAAFDEQLLNKLHDHCLNKIWTIGINNTNKPLLISDNPVVMTSHLGKPLAWGAKGTEVALPVSPNHLLIWTCPLALTQEVADNYDRRPFELHSDHIDYYNSLQTLQSTRYIYSARDDFSFCSDLLHDNESAFRDPLRSRAQINIGGDEYTVPRNYKNGI
ncbi:DUF4238 domain-containing protein [Bdellovibrio sp. BCCA]|uniref:DUF4238 domain-containing protein n=1 Tax=Bdellovibrio sp. BCCA TaxID=3136281 RepID=UPI0030F34461